MPQPTPPVEQPGLAELAKSFDPAAIEAPWQAHWESLGLHRAGAQGQGQPSTQAAEAGHNFSIQLPPPNVTGTLHMGHAFNQTIMDSLTRYHRMLGHNTAWIPGTDHAGIATQIVVERQLQAEGKSRDTMGPTPEQARQNFVARVWQWKEQSGNTITQQMRRMGASVDWSREYFTMDDRLSRIVTETFVRLYQQGLIYRGKRLVNWDPVLQSAVSDLEVESTEAQGALHYMCYPFANGPQTVDGEAVPGLVVATTRPETMLGDSAVAVHPDDARYQHLVGQHVQLPLCERTIPIIADDFVDPAFGSGVVKITGAHDFNDYACAQRHQLPLINIFALDATLNDTAPPVYRGLDRFEARQAVLRDLQDQGLLVEVKPHQLMLPICTRTGQVVEPMLTDQWFVATTQVGAQDATGLSMAQKARHAVDSGAVKFFPENWVNTYHQWMDNIQDWCISRQLWWGHQIPAWYDDQGQVYVARTEAEAQAQAPGKTLRRDPDVLDTWYSSALVPFSTMGWPEAAQSSELLSDYNLYLPSSVLITGYDIIFFWVARMIMMTTHFTGQVPFRHVYIHGLVRDAQGRKMSKSEGNVLDPVDLIDGIALPPLLDKRTTGLRRPETAAQVRQQTEKEFPNGIPAFGADALRLTFAALATLGRNINFDTKRCEGYRNFCNKLWNATRFVLMQCEGHDCGLMPHTKADCAPGGKAHGYMHFSSADRWIASALQRTQAEVARGFAEYRLDVVAQAIYRFVWDEFCDWYLEIAKVQLQSSTSDAQATARATRRTLIRTLETVLRLAHPIMPFITEALWQKVAPVAGRAGPSVAVAAYPVAQPNKIDAHADAEIAQLKAWVEACRGLRGEMGVSPADKLTLTVLAEDDFATRYRAVLCALARLSDVSLVGSESDWNQATGHSPVAVVGNSRLCLPIRVDPEVERTRLGKEIGRLQSERNKAHGKLNNQAFVAKAPAAVVEQERQRLEAFDSSLEKLQAQLARLG
ncbi:MAG: valine--tRNA ligase [Proteobacteria bacterium]|nr:valine--tRNA ligase [Pseudomonadota bacterium]MDA1327621.1 valine--tRNA ligase [Pseudomonadota bacterium]